jgi:NAD-dependent dihydropyrimidine dehydrogenase PreA subunit
MNRRMVIKVIVQFLVVVIITVLLSLLSADIWRGDTEKIPERISLVFADDMTVAAFGTANELPNPVLKEVLSLTRKADFERPLASFGLTQKQITKRVEQSLALAAESSAKNWVKIRIKFLFWFIFLGIIGVLMFRKRIGPGVRKLLYSITVVLFGIVLGSDPSPMGTVKDAVVLYGARHVVFWPRVIAFGIFFAMVLLANKFICAWGCQFGTVQDLIFRLNRDAKDRSGLLLQIKLPFVLTNAVRIVFFGALTICAFMWAVDIVEPIDPFKLYKPAVLAWSGGMFVGAILLSSLFIYRPWCHLFCPFGLIGWLGEKISVSKITVNYDTCIACEACAKACPSTVMGAILKRDRIIPDCFACATCITTCPTNSISWELGSRAKPPHDKFKKRTNRERKLRRRIG